MDAAKKTDLLARIKNIRDYQLTPWEKDFLKSIESWIEDDVDLSTKQLHTLIRMGDKYRIYRNV